jgi:DNA-binding SARP family transcriptional activator
MGRLAFSLLGIPSLVVTGRGPARIASACWPIIGFLLTRPGAIASRSRLAGALWPDQSEASARRCLATALWRFRTALDGGRCPLAADGEHVVLKLDAATWADTRAFESRVRPIVDSSRASLDNPLRARLRRAVRLYRGDFLAGHDQEWVAPERERLRCLYLDSLYALAHADAAAEDWPSVVTVARRLCVAEPLREDAQRLLMNAYAQAGNRALAIRQYSRLVETLQVELGVDPMPETAALATALGWTVRAPAPPPPMPSSVREALSASREAVGTALRIIEGALAVTRG